jgi:hypothetical protein
VEDIAYTSPDRSCGVSRICRNWVGVEKDSIEQTIQYILILNRTPAFHQCAPESCPLLLPTQQQSCPQTNHYITRQLLPRTSKITLCASEVGPPSRRSSVSALEFASYDAGEISHPIICKSRRTVIDSTREVQRVEGKSGASRGCAWLGTRDV